MKMTVLRAFPRMSSGLGLGSRPSSTNGNLTHDVHSLTCAALIQLLPSLWTTQLSRTIQSTLVEKTHGHLLLSITGLLLRNHLQAISHRPRFLRKLPHTAKVLSMDTWENRSRGLAQHRKMEIMPTCPKVHPRTSRKLNNKASQDTTGRTNHNAITGSASSTLVPSTSSQPRWLASSGRAGKIQF